MDALVVAGQRFEASTPMMARAIRHFRRVLSGRNVQASAKAPRVQADPVAVWDRIVAIEIAEGRTRQEAVAECVKRYPAAHKAMLVAYNALHGRG